MFKLIQMIKSLQTITAKLAVMLATRVKKSIIMSPFSLMFTKKTPTTRLKLAVFSRPTPLYLKDMQWRLMMQSWKHLIIIFLITVHQSIHTKAFALFILIKLTRIFLVIEEQLKMVVFRIDIKTIIQAL